MNTTQVVHEGVSVRIGNRRFGSETKDFKEMAKTDVPLGMHALSEVLFAKSSLLELSLDSSDTEINAAYGDDIAMLRRYRQGFEEVVRAAVLGRAAADQTDARKFLSNMTENISGIVYEPTLELNAETLRLSRRERLERLQGQFRTDVESLKMSVTAWFHVLVENDYISVVEWLNPTSLCYHFFRTDQEKRELKRHVDDPGIRLDGRTVTTTVKSHVEIGTARHSHTVVNAVPHPIGQFAERVPERIAEIINAMPTEIRQFAAIVTGTATEERVLRAIDSSKIVEERHSVFVPDPAVTLFDTFAIAGYGGTNAEATQSVYKGHILSLTKKTISIGLVTTLFVAVVAEPFVGIRGMLILGVIGMIMTAVAAFSTTIVPQKPPKSR